MLKVSRIPGKLHFELALGEDIVDIHVFLKKRPNKIDFQTSTLNDVNSLVKQCSKPLVKLKSRLVDKGVDKDR